MPIVTSGTNIAFPSAVGDTLYFIKDAEFTSYKPGSGVTTIPYTPHAGATFDGLSPIFNNTKVAAFIHYTVGKFPHYYLVVYTPSTGTWETAATDTGMPGAPSIVIPRVCTISGDTQYIFYGQEWAFDHPAVYVADLTAGTATQINDMSGTSLVFAKDMILSNRYDGASVGELFVHYADATGTSGQIMRYTLPASAPYGTGTWDDVTPTQFTQAGSQFATYNSNDINNVVHEALATVVTRSVSDEVYVRYVNTSGYISVLKHTVGTAWTSIGYGKLSNLSSFVTPSAFKETAGILICGYYDATGAHNCGGVP
jgi:hypothetical protein